MSKASGNVKVVHRDSKSGEFVTKRYADHHPATTERERIKMPPPAPVKKSK
jgi:hypothetical protein